MAAAQTATIKIDSLSYEVSIYGDVVLHWSIPQGVDVSHYTVYRGPRWNDLEQIAEIYSPTARVYTDQRSNLVPGTTYIYALEATDRQGNYGWNQIYVTVTPPPTGLKFTSIPAVTAFVGKDYWYSPLEVDAVRAEDVEYTFGGPRPDGMELNSVAGGIFTYLYWRPIKTGQYPITLIATHKRTRAIAVQEFTINVANQAGTVKGYVRALDDKPLVNASVRVFQVQNGMAYDAVTDSLGEFLLPSVQVGEIYAYARPNSTRYAPQWYTFGRNMSEVAPRPLREGDTIVFPFHLMTSADNPTAVRGTVRNIIGSRLADTKVSFVRKSNFIHIGDTTIISDPSFLDNYKVDTSVITDANGDFTAYLGVDREYYAFAQRQGYAMAVSPNRGAGPETNVLLARPFKIKDGIADLQFSLIPMDIQTPNRIVGTVKNDANGVDKQAVVVLIDPDLKRGAGGGHTYRQYRTTVTDENGYYFFENLGYTSTFTVLAIPLEKGLIPQYFSSNGGTTVASSSDIVSALGTVQNINFELPTVTTGGVGTIFGRVMLQNPDNVLTPAPGTLIFAEHADEQEIRGYAISDSSGWYSIPGLPQGAYTIAADNMIYGQKISPVIALDYTTYNLFTASRKVDVIYPMGTTAVEEPISPDEIVLYPNHPNPFNPATAIRFSVPRDTRVSLRVYNALGQEVSTLFDGTAGAGLHTVNFDGSQFASGVYYYRLQANASVFSRAMTLMK